MRDPEGKPLSRGCIQKGQDDPHHRLGRSCITLLVVSFSSCELASISTLNSFLNRKVDNREATKASSNNEYLLSILSTAPA